MNVCGYSSAPMRRPSHQRERHERELGDVTSGVERRRHETRWRRQNPEPSPQLGRRQLEASIADPTMCSRIISRPSPVSTTRSSVSAPCAMPGEMLVKGGRAPASAGGSDAAANSALRGFFNASESRTPET